MQAMNVQSNRKGAGSPAPLQYFVVEASWIRRAWPVFSGRSPPQHWGEQWKDELGSIQNQSLLQERQAEVSEDEDEEEPVEKKQTQHHQNMLSELHQRTQHHSSSSSPTSGHKKERMANATTEKLQRRFVHGQDFVLVGSNVVSTER
jgi:hypothetical protein